MSPKKMVDEILFFEEFIHYIKIECLPRYRNIKRDIRAAMGRHGGYLSYVVAIRSLIEQSIDIYNMYPILF